MRVTSFRSNLGHRSEVIFGFLFAEIRIRFIGILVSLVRLFSRKIVFLNLVSLFIPLRVVVVLILRLRHDSP